MIVSIALVGSHPCVPLFLKYGLDLGCNIYLNTSLTLLTIAVLSSNVPLKFSNLEAISCAALDDSLPSLIAILDSLKPCVTWSNPSIASPICFLNSAFLVPLNDLLLSCLLTPISIVSTSSRVFIVSSILKSKASSASAPFNCSFKLFISARNWSFIFGTLVSSRNKRNIICLVLCIFCVIYILFTLKFILSLILI